MPIDFPNSPTLNQVFTVGGNSWKWNGTTWNVVRIPAGATGPTGPTGATGPSGPSGATGATGPGATNNGWVLVSNQFVQSLTAQSVTITGLSAYNEFQISYARNDADAATTHALIYSFNGGGAANNKFNYISNFVYGYNGNLSLPNGDYNGTEVQPASNVSLPGDFLVQRGYAAGNLFVYNNKATTNAKKYSFFGQGRAFSEIGRVVQTFVNGIWDNTSAIDTVTFTLSYGTGNFGAKDFGGGIGIIGGTTFAVWGRA